MVSVCQVLVAHSLTLGCHCVRWGQWRAEAWSLHCTLCPLQGPQDRGVVCAPHLVNREGGGVGLPALPSALSPVARGEGTAFALLVSGSKSCASLVVPGVEVAFRALTAAAVAEVGRQLAGLGWGSPLFCKYFYVLKLKDFADMSLKCSLDKSLFRIPWQSGNALWLTKK